MKNFRYDTLRLPKHDVDKIGTCLKNQKINLKQKKNYLNLEKNGSPPETRLGHSRNSEIDNDGSVKLPINPLNDTLKGQVLSPLLFTTDRNMEENQSNNYEVEDFELVQPSIISANVVKNKHKNRAAEIGV